MIKNRLNNLALVVIKILVTKFFITSSSYLFLHLTLMLRRWKLRRT